MNNQALERTDIREKVENYWDTRSDSYSQQNLAELHCFKRDAWRSIILENAPQKDKLRILDVGTGPGFFAINLALAGHEVTAVDLASAMLQKASENANHYGVKINFRQGNVHELPFPDEEFDLVLSRNVVWNLEEPERALKEWLRVIRKGGRILYFDANWYLHLFDDNLRTQYFQAQEEADRRFARGVMPKTEMRIKMEDIARNLPLSREYRPQWDQQALERCNVKIIKIAENIGDLVWNEEEKVRHRVTPMFMVCAEK
ncbi:MAG: class I SAM-dependent methyltransferase [Desulfitobacterium sp.]|nr:class I SAM-dependent methyltransferase [Desulfitobacterium sp.]